jgi:hypothetical protein
MAFLTLLGMMGAASKPYVFSLRSGAMLPAIPEGGFRSAKDLAAAGGREISAHPDFVPGLDPGTYVYTVVTTRGNLFRVPVP